MVSADAPSCGLLVGLFWLVPPREHDLEKDDNDESDARR